MQAETSDDAERSDVKLSVCGKNMCLGFAHENLWATWIKGCLGFFTILRIHESHDIRAWRLHWSEVWGVLFLLIGLDAAHVVGNYAGITLKIAMSNHCLLV